jgi:hypothetical protein
MLLTNQIIALDRINVEDVEPTTALAKIKAAGRKAAYPFKKSTIAGLAEDVESCQDALQVAISVLQLNVSATTVEQLEKLDDKLVANTTKLELALRDLELSSNTARSEIMQHLLQNRKLLTVERNETKAMSIIESLNYPQMFDRERQVSTADDSSLGWLFAGEESKHQPQLMDLLAFFEEGSGLFWIHGKPASGKSTL